MALLRKREEWADFRRANLNAWGMRLAEAEGTLMKDEYDWTGRLSSWEADLKERESIIGIGIYAGIVEIGLQPTYTYRYIRRLPYGYTSLGT